MAKKCPKCNSENIKLVAYLGVKAVKCNNCGFDERRQYEVFPEHRETQREKTRFNPYKIGGKSRIRKK